MRWKKDNARAMRSEPSASPPPGLVPGPPPGMPLPPQGTPPGFESAGARIEREMGSRPSSDWGDSPVATQIFSLVPPVPPPGMPPPGVETPGARMEGEMGMGMPAPPPPGMQGMSPAPPPGMPPPPTESAGARIQRGAGKRPGDAAMSFTDLLRGELGQLNLKQVLITRRAHKYFPVHRADVNTSHLSRSCGRGRGRMAWTGTWCVVGRGHVSLLTNSDAWHSKRVRDIADL
jgi:hypothetical protein